MIKTPDTQHAKATGDLVLQEVWRAKDTLSAQYGHNLDKLFTETSQMQTRLIQKHFGEVIRRFQAALIRAVPDRDPGDILWKFYFSVGSMIFALNALDEIGELTGGRCDASDLDGLTHRLVNFLAAGFRS